MKRFVAGSVFAVALFAASVSAQGTQFGVRGAISAHALYNDYYTYKTGIGYGGGLVLKQTLSDQLSIQAEASFYYRNLYNNNAYDYINEMAVCIPVMVNWYVPRDRFPGYVIAGLQADIPFSTKRKDIIEYDISDDRSSVDIGLVIGAGYLFARNVGIDARYVFNFNEPIDFHNTYSYLLMSYSLGLLILF